MDLMFMSQKIDRLTEQIAGVQQAINELRLTVEKVATPSFIVSSPHGQEFVIEPYKLFDPFKPITTMDTPNHEYGPHPRPEETS